MWIHRIMLTDSRCLLLYQTSTPFVQNSSADLCARTQLSARLELAKFIIHPTSIGMGQWHNAYSFPLRTITYVITTFDGVRNHFLLPQSTYSRSRSHAALPSSRIGLLDSVNAAVVGSIQSCPRPPMLLSSFDHCSQYRKGPS